MASGLIGLTLSANPRLSWRDVQHIIVRTARPGPVKGSKWNTNKAGLKVSDRVGFGLMDAKKMVDLAVNWTTVPPKVICRVPRYGANSQIPSKEVLEETINLINWRALCGSKINFLEHVEVAVNLNYTLRGDLLIKLISPQGTSSNLTHYRMVDSAGGATDLNWVLMSLHYWGESAIGPWKLTLQNSQLHNHNTGILFNWTLILHGTTLNPLDYNPHISTTVSPQPTEKRQLTESSSVPSKHTSSSTESFSSESFTSTSRKKKSAIQGAAAWQLGVGLGVSLTIALVLAMGVALVCYKKKSCRSHPGFPQPMQEERKGERNSCGEFNMTVNL